MKALSRLSIRNQLVTLYTMALLAILLPVLGTSYLFVRHHVLSSFDEELEEEADEALLVMSQGASDGEPIDALDRLESVEDVWFELWSPTGELFYRQRLPESHVRVLPRIGTRGGAYSVYPSAGERLRVFERPASVAGHYYQFRVVAPVMAIDSMLGRLLLIHLLGLVTALGLAGVSGHFLARRALAPVQMITERARVMTTDKLKEGIPVVNPADELGQLASTFNATFARLGTTLDRLQEFTADASHELRNPLTAIRNVAEVGLDSDESGKQNSLESILEETDRMARILEGLLMMARMEHGEVVLAAEDIELGEIARDVTERLDLLAEARSQELRLSASPDVRVHADPVYVRQALMNIVDNAIKHGSGEAPIDIRVEANGSGGIVAVRDYGPGISPEHRERVFERFYSVDKARSRSLGGSGLGLSIATWSIEANGGRIELTSEVGAGSEFRIVLPAAHDRQA